MNINKIYNEDCLNTMSKIQTDSIDLVFTSPPYLNAREYSQYESIKDYMDKMNLIFTECHRVLSPSRMCVVNISPVIIPREKRSKQSYRIPLPFYFVPMMEDIGFEFLEDIIWEKPDGSAKNRNGIFYRNRKPVAYKPNIVTEYVFVFKKKAQFLIDKIIRQHSDAESLVDDGYERTNIWKINPETSVKHPAPFPTELAEKIIKYYSYVGDIVFDPFIGSGTTAVAAKKLNRNFIGSELVPEYCKLANERIKKIST